MEEVITEKTINKEDIIKHYDFLNHKGISELRLIRPLWVKEKVLPHSHFITNKKELVEIISSYNGEWDIYIGINEREREGKNDNDVKFITNIGHDIDAHDKTEESLQKAGQVIISILESCKNQGYKEPLVINSGYGYWIIHHISPIENTKENIEKIKEFGKRVKTLHQIEGIEIDSTVYNPSRIIRVGGTLNLRDKENYKLSFIMNNPKLEEDDLLAKNILNIEIKKYEKSSLANSTSSINSFMDFCLTHELPKEERHKTISRHIAAYISDHPDRELLKEQYIKIQKGSEGELDQWLKKIDKEGKEKFPLIVGELINFTRKYKIPFDWKLIPEYQQWLKEKRAITNLNKKIEEENHAEEFKKAIKFFIDKRHLAKQFLNIQPLFYDENKIWWVWIDKNKCWKICDETDILNKISRHSEANTISSSEKNEILESLKQESRLLKPKKIENTWIQFKNIIYDLKTGESFEATPEYFITNPIPFELSSSIETPTMDRIFKEWVKEEDVQTLYEIIAYCMLIDYPINRLFCLIGSGMNGKSCFLRLLLKTIGKENACSTELDLLIKSRFEVTKLHKKLVCIMGETNFNELSQTSILKKLTGGDLIGFEYKNKLPFDDKNYAKIIIATNNLPITTDKTAGFYRRWHIVDFPNIFTEQKDILSEIPEEEYNNLVSKCLLILNELLVKREFTNEGSVDNRMERFEARSDFLQKFMDLFTEKDINGYVTKHDFIKKFGGWCKERGFRQLSDSTIGKNMQNKGFETSRKHFDWLHDGKGGQIYVWYGLKWKI